ncbi:MAG: hypothetical protein MK033_06330 [Candidatus Caenarcaniphilales bacterium]|nr:hypothetical protein [Candidatus Caenarcaniphilales bacterium]
MRFLCLSLIILSLSTCLNTSAKNSAKLNKELLISAQIESVLMDYYERKKLADEENSHYFVIALISSGKNEEAKELLKQLIKKYPKNEKFPKDLKSLYIFEQDFKSAQELGLTESELSHLELKKVFFETGIENSKLSHLNSDSKFPLFEELKKIDNRSPYLPSKLEYLFLTIKFLSSFQVEGEEAKTKEKELRDFYKLIELCKKQIKKDAQKIITQHKKKLFPKTLDFYELGEAYRVLALLSFLESEQLGKFGLLSQNLAADAEKKKQELRIYFQMADQNYKRMRSIWLEEDTKYFRPIMQDYETVTEFGYVLPQWVITVQRLN